VPELVAACGKAGRATVEDVNGARRAETASQTFDRDADREIGIRAPTEIRGGQSGPEEFAVVCELPLILDCVPDPRRVLVPELRADRGKPRRGPIEDVDGAGLRGGAGLPTR
jgi:hypothetical protein